MKNIRLLLCLFLIKKSCFLTLKTVIPAIKAIFCKKKRQKYNLCEKNAFHILFEHVKLPLTIRNTLETFTRDVR